MERVFDTIDRLRSTSEETRRRLLFVSVGVIALLLGTVWAMTIRWQLVPLGPAEPVAEESALPSVGEVLSRGTSDTWVRAKAMLREFLQESERAQESASGDVVMPESRVRLPSGGIE